jgi:hypothetical protein
MLPWMVRSLIFVLMSEEQYPKDPAADVWMFRLAIAFVYLLASLLAVFFLGIFLVGLFRWRIGIMLVGASLCYSLVILWKRVGWNICQGLRRDRDRARARRAEARRTGNW